jgi:predicted porin
MRWWVLLLAPLLVGSAGAEPLFKQERFYFGAGFGNTKVSGQVDNKTTIQGFAGYRMITQERWGLSLELGYQDTSDLPHDGGWLTPVLGYHVTDQVELLLRGGGEVGDDDGALWGAGVGYRLERNMDVRLEYVERTLLRGVQLNVVFHPWWYRR